MSYRVTGLGKHVSFGSSQRQAISQDDYMSQLNTTPLIDVMLVLLIMIIVSTQPNMHAMLLDTNPEYGLDEFERHLLPVNRLA